MQGPWVKQQVLTWKAFPPLWQSLWGTALSGLLLILWAWGDCTVTGPQKTALQPGMCVHCPLAAKGLEKPGREPSLPLGLPRGGQLTSRHLSWGQLQLTPTGFPAESPVAARPGRGWLWSCQPPCSGVCASPPLCPSL